MGSPEVWGFRIARGRANMFEIPKGTRQSEWKDRFGRRRGLRECQARPWDTPPSLHPGRGISNPGQPSFGTWPARQGLRVALLSAGGGALSSLWICGSYLNTPLNPGGRKEPLCCALWQPSAPQSRGIPNLSKISAPPAGSSWGPARLQASPVLTDAEQKISW